LIAAAVAALVIVATPGTAAAQTLIPDLSPITGGDKQATPKEDERECSPGVTLICAGEALGAGAVDLVGTGVGMAGDAVMGGIVSWAASGAAWLVTSVAAQIEQSTRPALGSAWFSRQYRGMREMAVSLSLLFLLAAIVQAVVRQDLAMLLRSCLAALPLALLLTFAAVTLVELGLALTDTLTESTLRQTEGDLEEAFSDLATVLAPTAVVANPLPGLVLFLGALLTAALAMVVWIELILREAAIYVTVAFLPIALAAAVWPRTSHWARRLAEWLTAIVLAKLTIAASFAVAGSMLAHGRGGSGGLTAILAGCTVLLVAALSPWVLLRLIPFAEQAAGSLHRGHVGGALRTAPGAGATTLLVRQAMLKSFGAGFGAAAATTRVRPWGPITPTSPPIARGGSNSKIEGHR
jgi:hypothetical protein